MEGEKNLRNISAYLHPRRKDKMSVRPSTSAPNDKILWRLIYDYTLTKSVHKGIKANYKLL